MKFINENQSKNNGVYVIENITNNKKYIGSTFRKDQNGFKIRFNSYSKHSSTYYNKKLTNAIKKHGLHNFIFKIVEIVNTSIVDCRLREEHYIALYNTVNTGYNIKVQGTGGNGGANKGKKYPKPTREVILRRARACSNSKKGIKFSEAHKLAIKQSRLTDDYWGKKYVFLKNAITNKITMFRSRTEAAQSLGCCITQIWSLLTKKSKVLCKVFVKCSNEEIETFLKEHHLLLKMSEIRY